MMDKLSTTATVAIQDPLSTESDQSNSRTSSE